MARDRGDTARIRYYAYHDLGTARDDLESGRIGLVIKPKKGTFAKLQAAWPAPSVSE